MLDPSSPDLSGSPASPTSGVAFVHGSRVCKITHRGSINSTRLVLQNQGGRGGQKELTARSRVAVKLFWYWGNPVARDTPRCGVTFNKIYKCTDKRVFPRKAIRVMTKDFLEWEGLD